MGVRRTLTSVIRRSTEFAEEIALFIGFDHAVSWIYLADYYYTIFAPFLLITPPKFQTAGFIVLGAVTLGSVFAHVRSYFDNKKKIYDRRIRCNLNQEEMLNFIKNSSYSSDEYMDHITTASFDVLSSELKDGSLDQVTVLLAFQLKALQISSTNAIAEYILNESTGMTIPRDLSENKDPNALYGLPVSLSDIIELHGEDRTLGLGGYVGEPSKSDANIVKVLRSCGAHPFLRTNLSQALSYCPSLASSNPIFGVTTHPLSNLRSPGGGAFGEACAIALNASILGVGADIAGDVRIPAHFCGVAALRTTSQRVSTRGLKQGQSLVSSCVGPMARDVSALVAFMRSMCGYSQNYLDPEIAPTNFNEKLFSSPKPLRIGYYVEDGYTQTTPAVIRAISEVKNYLEHKGHKLEEFDPPDMKHMLTQLFFPAIMGSSTHLWKLLSVDVVDPSVRRIYHKIPLSSYLRWLITWWWKTKSPIEAAVEESFMPGAVGEWLLLGEKIQEFKDEFNAKWRQARLDAIICPVMPCAAPKCGNENRLLACLTHVGLFSLLNFPAGTLPITRVTKSDLVQLQSSSSYLARTGLDFYIKQKDPKSSVLGFPIGIQIAAPPYHEEIILRIMQDLELAILRSSIEPGLHIKSILSKTASELEKDISATLAEEVTNYDFPLVYDEDLSSYGEGSNDEFGRDENASQIDNPVFSIAVYKLTKDEASKIRSRLDNPDHSGKNSKNVQITKDTCMINPAGSKMKGSAASHKGAQDKGSKASRKTATSSIEDPYQRKLSRTSQRSSNDLENVEIVSSSYGSFASKDTKPSVDLTKPHSLRQAKPSSLDAKKSSSIRSSNDLENVEVPSSSYGSFASKDTKPSVDLTKPHSLHQAKPSSLEATKSTSPDISVRKETISDSDKRTASPSQASNTKEKGGSLMVEKEKSCPSMGKPEDRISVVSSVSSASIQAKKASNALRDLQELQQLQQRSQSFEPSQFSDFSLQKKKSTNF